MQVSLKSVFILLFAFIISCQSENEKVIMQNINNDWSSNKTIYFEFDITNHEIPRNLIFVVRNNEHYSFSNLFVISKLNLKGDKNSITDTLNYEIAKDNGDWKGSGFGDTKELLVGYKSNLIFPKNGKYSLEIRHGMREKKLIGIEDFGIKIETQKLSYK